MTLLKRKKVEWVGETYVACVKNEANKKLVLGLTNSARSVLMDSWFEMKIGTQEINFDLEGYMKRLGIKSEKTARNGLRELCKKGIFKRLSAGVYEVNKSMYYADNVE